MLNLYTDGKVETNNDELAKLIHIQSRMTIIEKSCKYGSNNMIRFNLEDEIATMESYNIEYEEMKLFFIMIMDITDMLIEKGCKKVRMMTEYNDYAEFLKETDWAIVEQLETTVLLEIDVEKYPTAVAAGSGFEIV